jgi:hypothetical protein
MKRDVYDFWLEGFKGEYNVGEIKVNGEIILKWFFNKRFRKVRIGSQNF